MSAESTRKFEALEAQAALLMDVFTKAEYEHVAPSILQPASIFLDRVGEALRSRTYVFADPDGVELCLRPDLTLPVCRLYLERHDEPGEKARYCYNGPAFRYQPGGGDKAHPREFRQAGIECFGRANREKAEARLLGVVLKAVHAAGLEKYQIQLGDLGMFNALLDALDIPDHWRGRLKHNFWRPGAFRHLLTKLAGRQKLRVSGDLAQLVRGLNVADKKEARARIERYLTAQNIELIGARSIKEITERLLGWAADIRAEPLGEETVRLIEDYLSISAKPRAARARIDDLMSRTGIEMGAALKSFDRRLEYFAENGIDPNIITFSTEFGRELAYYSGTVFQIEVPELGEAGQIAGGGRYDHLLTSLGADEPVPAVGCAIHTQRLLAAVKGDLS